MCGACGANAPTSVVTGYLGLRGIEPAFTRALGEWLGPRGALSRAGGHWVLREPTGGTQLFRTAEELAKRAHTLAASRHAPPQTELSAEAAAGLAELRARPLAELATQDPAWDAQTLCQWVLAEVAARHAGSSGFPPGRA